MSVSTATGTTNDVIASTAEATQPVTASRAVLAHRFVQTGLFLGLVWKWDFFSKGIQVYAAIPLVDHFFPAWLQSTHVLAAAYLIAVGSILLNWFTASRLVQITCSFATLAGATVLCIHQGSYNDMTFVTTWWVAVWSMWYVIHMRADDTEGLLRRAALLSRLILSVILLGGAVGKWTGEYWSGAVFYDIYFVDRDFWLFNYLRANFDAESLRTMATWYSRKVIVIETLAGFGLWMLPARWASVVGMILLASIALLSNFLLFSVLMCLIGLASVGLLVPSSRRRLPVGNL